LAAGTPIQLIWRRIMVLVNVRRLWWVKARSLLMEMAPCEALVRLSQRLRARSNQITLSARLPFPSVRIRQMNPLMIRKTELVNALAGRIDIQTFREVGCP